MMFWEKFSNFLIYHRFFFFLGKGGTGKTTLSILLSNYFKKNVLLISLDPAHNISDFLNLDPKRERKRFKEIEIYEPHIEKLVNKKAYEEARKIENISPLFPLFENVSLRENMKFLPGMEEDVLIEIILNSQNENFEKIIFDMPPTGLSLRIISLLFFRKKIFKFLLNQRKKILELRKIKGEKIKEDGILNKIKENYEKYKNFIAHFQKNSLFFIIFTPEKASLLEGERIQKFLRGNKLEFKRIMNKWKKEKLKEKFDVYIDFNENILSEL